MGSRFALAVLVLGLCLGGPASAIDLTGTWTNYKSYSCRTTSDVNVQTDSYSSSPLEIAQTGGVLAIEYGVGNPWSGRVIVDPKGVGRGVAHYCGAVSGYAATIQILSVTTFPADANGITGKLVVLHHWVGATQHRECKKIEFLRTSLTDPTPIVCP